MLRIAGMGFAYPPTVINNDLLEQCNPQLSPAWIHQNLGIEHRFSVLPIPYILETGNVDPWQAKDVLLCTPTDLSERAARMALERAGITAEDVGLIIAEGATPLETTPSEAQRTGKRLGIKVPAYDVSGNAATFSLHMDILRKWRPESVPSYVLCIASNIPTQRVNFRKGTESAYFGDAAAAMVVSPRHDGRLKLVDSHYGNTHWKVDLMAFETYGAVSVRQDGLATLKLTVSQLLHRALESNAIALSDCRFIGHQVNFRELEELCTEFKIPSDRHWHNVDRCGYSLGSSAMCALAEKWDELRSGENIVVAEAGTGQSIGYVVLRS